MQKLMILRHAKAVPWGSTPDDFSRPLSDLGQAHAQAVAHWVIREDCLPDLALCSPSQRTRETIAPLVDAAGEMESRTRFLPQLYGASFDVLVNLLDHAFAEADSVMVVGHNPGLEHLLFEVISSSQRGKIRRLATGTLVSIEFEPDWAEAQGRGTIAHKVRGKKLID